MGNTIARSATLAAALFACLATTSSAQPAAAPRRTENVILVVIDGVRWQEVFGGADSLLLFADPKILGDDSADVRRAFWHADVTQRRKLLFPFLWDVVGASGQLFGSESGKVLVRNGLNFSYPGYNEMLTGFPDRRIDSNEHGPNENVSIFEWTAKQPGFAGRVAAFGTWGVFADIFNRQRSGLYVRAGWEPPYPSPRNALDSLQNRLYATTFREWGDNAYDSFTHEVAMRYLREHRPPPRLLFIGYGETDEWAHDGRYDRYLRAARQVDAYLEEIWRTVQGIPQYRGKTTLIVTTDHGRGESATDWTNHGKDVSGAERAWIGVLGRDTPSHGERNTASVTQSQIAATVAALLGLDYRKAVRKADAPIDVFTACATCRN